MFVFAILSRKILLQRDCSFNIVFQKDFVFDSNILFIWMRVDFCVLELVRIVIWLKISIDICYFDEIRKLSHMIHVVLRELTFHLFTISLLFFVVFFFVLIRCRIYDFHNERLSNENRRSRSHEFSTFNDLSFNDLSFEIDHFFLIFYNLLFVINHSQNYVNIFSKFEEQIIVSVRHDVCETTE